MATLTELVELEADILGEKPGSVLQSGKRLRPAGMITIGVQGPGRGAQMTPRDAVNLFLACALDHCHGADVAETVRQVRNLEFDSKSLLWIPVDGLTCWGARTAGEALENLIDDYRNGRVTKWAAGEKIKVEVVIDLRGSAVFVMLSKPDRDVVRGGWYAMADYAESGYAKNPLPIKRQMQINGSVFEKIAKALGPPPS